MFIINRRLEFHNILADILGSPNVYFQPPTSIQMIYPCIVYSRINILPTYADDVPYVGIDEYMVTVIDKNPDSNIPRKVLTIPTARFSRHYIAESLNHYAIEIYY